MKEMNKETYTVQYKDLIQEGNYEVIKAINKQMKKLIKTLIKR